MKAWFCVLTMVVLSASPALAAGLGLHGSYWDSKEADDAWGGGALFRLDLHRNLQLDIRGSFFKFDGVEKDIDFSGGMTWEGEWEGEPAEVEIIWFIDAQLELDFEVIPVEVALLAHFDLHDRITPYFGGGVGYFFLDAKVRKSEWDNWRVKTSNEFGFFSVGGLRILLNENISLFGEARYTWLEFDDVKYRFIFPSDSEIAEIKAHDDYETKLKMNGFGANVGLLFVF